MATSMVLGVSNVNPTTNTTTSGATCFSCDAPTVVDDIQYFILMFYKYTDATVTAAVATLDALYNVLLHIFVYAIFVATFILLSS